MVMLTTTKGIVISSRNVGENDRSISIITEELGVVDILCKGAQKNTSKNNASTQLFAYAKFCYNESKERYYLNSSEPINIFYGLRTDIKKVALASYIAELLKYSVMSLEPEEEVLRLTLNTFYYIAEDKRSCELMKSIFELRFACLIGYIPGLLGCYICHRYKDDHMYLIMNNGRLMCTPHFYHKYVTGPDEEDFFPFAQTLDVRMLHIVRVICLTELEKVFSLNIDGDYLRDLNRFTECYLMEHIGHHFKTLDFYNSLDENKE